MKTHRNIRLFEIKAEFFTETIGDIDSDSDNEGQPSYIDLKLKKLYKYHRYVFTVIAFLALLFISVKIYLA